jgi:2-desacetyl-2-hydroxyethyl bacteriochlorophyllide A dehydrogenase
MGSVVRFEAPATVTVVDEADPPLGPTDVRLRTLYSGVSAGTELTAYRGTNPSFTKRWDSGQRLFVPGRTTLEYPADGWGYEEVGAVAEIGGEVTAVRPGQVIWGVWGHRAATVVTEEYAAARVLDPAAEPLLGIFSHIGAVALNVLLDADIHVGETVAVFGLGVPGQIVAQLARLNGARVVAVDAIQRRLDLAWRLGAAETIDAGQGSVAEQVRALTQGRGADVSLEVSGNYRALHEAVRATAYGSRVVAAGFYQGDGVGLALGEEFHHNRTQIVSSQISGVAPGVSHRWDRYRLASTAINLAVSGRLQLEPLVSHVLPAAAAAKAFDLLATSPEEALQVVLQFGAAGGSARDTDDDHGP